MSGVLAKFRPINGQALGNVPHMLRYWADVMERGEEPTPTTALLVLITDGNTPAEFCVFGVDPSRAELGGTLYALGQRVLGEDFA